jgi:NAD-specific glutamate dehydrogenase
MKPKTDLSLKEFKDQSLNGAKRCDEAKLPVIIARDDKLKKIHKTSRKGKPTTMQRIATKEKEDKEEKEELPDTFDKVFEKVYKEKCTLNSLLLNIHDMEELADPDAIALYLIKNMAWAVHHYP